MIVTDNIVANMRDKTNKIIHKAKSDALDYTYDMISMICNKNHWDISYDTDYSIYNRITNEYLDTSVDSDLPDEEYEDVDKLYDLFCFMCDILGYPPKFSYKDGKWWS